MKKIKIFLLIVFLATGFSVNALSSGNGNNSNHNGHRSRFFHHRNGNTIGAPLDGGLLAVLGIAGVAYLAARKKAKKLES